MFGFKPDAKTAVTVQFHRLFGRNLKPVVTGHRASSSPLQYDGVPRGAYVAQLHVGGLHVATAYHRDWRTAYKALAIELTRLHGEGLRFEA